MKTFRLKADATFEAENLDNAFFKLSSYFHSLAQEEPEETIFQTGEIGISFDVPVKP